jgi:hypothetical protein
LKPQILVLGKLMRNNSHRHRPITQWCSLLVLKSNFFNFHIYNFPLFLTQFTWKSKLVYESVHMNYHTWWSITLALPVQNPPSVANACPIAAVIRSNFSTCSTL